MTLVSIPHHSGSNIYVQELVRGYEALGCTVVFGFGKLMNTGVTPDILHLQWPEEHYRWNAEGPIEVGAKRFLDRLADLKRNGCKIAWTVHNLGPHESLNDPLDHSVYQQVMDTADLIVHHCPESARLLAKKYRVPEDKPHLIAPHGNYFGYPNSVSREQARKRLGIPGDACVYLSFGAIRGYKGIDTLLDSFRRVKSTHKMLLVAGSYMAITSRGYFYDRMLMAWKGFGVGGRGVKLHLKTIPSEEVQLYFNAADCLVLSHSRGLNSGVAVLGMSFGKTVVGPRIGCIEWVLDQGDNVTYPVGDADGFIQALDTAGGRAGAGVNVKNLEVARSWRWTDIAEGVIEKLGFGAARFG